MGDVKKIAHAGAEAGAKKAAEELLKRLGVAGAGVAFTLTEAVMTMVEENTRKKLDRIRKDEGCPHIQACSEISGWTGSQTNAISAAQLGWIAWQAPSGLWVFHHQHDYPPRFAQMIWRPLHKGADRFWSVVVENQARRGTGKTCRKCDEAWVDR